jgi:phosphatidylglycerol:prolipoprotein diacylglycerol transferase
MIALGFLLFSYLTFKHPWRKALISKDDFWRVLFICFVGAVIGGRLLFVLFELPRSWSAIKEVFYPWIGGFSLFGSIIAVLATAPIYLIFKKVPVFRFFDLIALHAPILQAISRIGCFLAGCCYGAHAHPRALWSITFTSYHSLAPVGVALYPTQLYSVVISLSIFVILKFVSEKVSKTPGVLLCLYLMMESLSRFFVDFWRGDRGELTFGLFSSMQLIVMSLFIFVTLGLSIIVSRRG